ncbi:MAG: copper homeostasis protein CutC [Rubripirellula sp.]
MILEICIDHIRSAKAAKAGGADRLEICGPLCVGGTTPSAALIEQCLELGDIELVAMVRPHAGGFDYHRDDIDTMLRSIRQLKTVGVSGVAFGVLTTTRLIDIESMKRLIDVARPMKVTCHRAFDVAIDPLAAMDTLIELEVDRLLTSGQAHTAFAGIQSLAELVKRAEGNLAIIAASGIDSSNAGQIVQQTGVREIHGSASESEATAGPIDFGGRMINTSVQAVRRLHDAIEQL